MRSKADNEVLSGAFGSESVTAQDVQSAVAQGVSIVCATCDHFWEGVGRNLGRCTAPGPCGSPIAGDVFTHYQGPITDFTRYCFVCGEQPAKVLKVENLIRLIGVCEKHRSYLRDLVPASSLVRPIEVLTVDDGKSAKDLDKTEPKTLGSLLSHIASSEGDE